MVEIGIYEAKKHFSDFIRRVQKGEEFLVTNRGEVVAKITAPKESLKNKSKKVFSDLRNLMKTAPLAGSLDELLEMKNEGRK